MRRSGHTIRITAQFVNAATGFQLWSRTYDRDLGDVLKLQTEIATAVASALKVTLLGDVAAKIELGGTRNPAAFDAYLRGAKAYISKRDRQRPRERPLPPTLKRFASIRTMRSLSRPDRWRFLVAGEATTAGAMREGNGKAQADAHQRSRSRRIWPRPTSRWGSFRKPHLDFTLASDEYKRAPSLTPGSAEVLRRSGRFAAIMGDFDAGIAAARRAVLLDPLAREKPRAARPGTIRGPPI